MKFIEKFISDEIPRYYYYIFGFITIFFILFYIYYALSAWFFQDDIVFIYSFSKDLLWHNQFPYDNFYRFLSINLYWHFLYKFFGDTAALYFIFNLMTLSANALVLFLFVRGISKDATIAVAASVIYFIMPPSMKNYTWICNNQHLMSHFLIFMFCHVYFNKGGAEKLGIKQGMVLSALFISSLLCNFLGAFIVPCIIFYHIININEKKFNRTNIMFLAVWSMILIAFVIVSRKLVSTMQLPQYGMDISFATFIKTLQSYSYHIYKSVPLLVITILIIYITGLVKKDKLVIFFISASICFYIPFAFMIFQKNANYLVLGYLCYCIAILIIMKKHARVPVLLLLFVLYNFINTRAMMKECAENPAGSKLKLFISQMKDEYYEKGLHSYKKIYFQTDEPLNYKTGIESIDTEKTPVFWGRLEGEQSLKHFVDPDLEYLIVNYGEVAPKDYPVVTVSKDLYSRQDKGFKKITMPPR